MLSLMLLGCPYVHRGRIDAQASDTDIPTDTNIPADSTSPTFDAPSDASIDTSRIDTTADAGITDAPAFDAGFDSSVATDVSVEPSPVDATLDAPVVNTTTDQGTAVDASASSDGGTTADTAATPDSGSLPDIGRDVGMDTSVVASARNCPMSTSLGSDCTCNESTHFYVICTPRSRAAALIRCQMMLPSALNLVLPTDPQETELVLTVARRSALPQQLDYPRVWTSIIESPIVNNHCDRRWVDESTGAVVAYGDDVGGCYQTPTVLTCSARECVWLSGEPNIFGESAVVIGAPPWAAGFGWMDYPAMGYDAWVVCE